jgi:hypothetical protein
MRKNMTISLRKKKHATPIATSKNPVDCGNDASARVRSRKSANCARRRGK